MPPDVEQLELAERAKAEWEKLVHRADAQGVAIEAIYPDGVQLSEPDFRRLLAAVEEAEFEGHELKQIVNCIVPPERRDVKDAAYGRVQELLQEIRALQRKLRDLGGDPEEDPLGELADPDERQLGPFTRDSETSRKAALANYPRQGSQRWRILTKLHTNERITPPGRPRGLTREQLADQLALSGDTIRPRVVELIAGGWVEESEGFTRKTRAGNDAALVMLTEKALREPRLVEASSG